MNNILAITSFLLVGQLILRVNTECRMDYDDPRVLAPPPQGRTPAPVRYAPRCHPNSVNTPMALNEDFCSYTCDGPMPYCDEILQGMLSTHYSICHCEPGFYVNSTGECISLEACNVTGYPKCALGEVLAAGNVSEKICGRFDVSDKSPRITWRGHAYTCACQPGMVRDPQGYCSLLSECTIEVGPEFDCEDENEVLVEDHAGVHDEPAYDRVCHYPNMSRFYGPKFRKEGKNFRCKCAKCFARYETDGRCLPYDLCRRQHIRTYVNVNPNVSPQDCYALCRDQEYPEFGGDCEPVCDKSGEKFCGPASLTRVGILRCACDRDAGFSRHSNGSCVNTTDCVGATSGRVQTQPTFTKQKASTSGDEKCSIDTRSDPADWPVSTETVLKRCKLGEYGWYGELRDFQCDYQCEGKKWQYDKKCNARLHLVQRHEEEVLWCGCGLGYARDFDGKCMTILDCLLLDEKNSTTSASTTTTAPLTQTPAALAEFIEQRTSISAVTERRTSPMPTSGMTTSGMRTTQAAATSTTPPSSPKPSGTSSASSISDEAATASVSSATDCDKLAVDFDRVAIRTASTTSSYIFASQTCLFIAIGCLIAALLLSLGFWAVWRRLAKGRKMTLKQRL